MVRRVEVNGKKSFYLQSTQVDDKFNLRSTYNLAHSNIVLIASLDAIPGSVQRFQCKYMPGNNVTCSWLPPLSYETSVSGYILGWKSTKTKIRKEIHLNRSLSQFIISHLGNKCHTFIS